jgi:hypothetical protein
VLLIVGGFILPLTAILTLPGTLAHDTLYNFQIVFIVAAPVFIVIGIVMLVRGLRVRWK